MESTSKPSMIGLVAVLFRIASKAIARAFTYPFRSKRAPSLHKDVLFAAVRAMLSQMSVPQFRYINPSTTAMYLKFCEANHCQPQTLEVEGPTGKIKGHWIGNPESDNVILYLHGGGYVQPASEGYFQYFTRLVNELNGVTNQGKKHRSAAVLILAYTLSPEAIYPTQLREASLMLSELLKTRSPSNIIISGDSAGGNLSLSLLSHILHPHPEVPSIKLSEPLAGAFLYSPWVSFRTDYASFEKNIELDVLPDDMLRRWAAMFLGKSNPANPEAAPSSISGNAYCEPNANSTDWWANMHLVVSYVFVWSGGNEVFVDPVREFREKFTAGWSSGGGHAERVVFMETPGEAHIGPIMDIMVKSRKNGVGEHQLAIDEWHKARLEEL